MRIEELPSVAGTLLDVREDADRLRERLQFALNEGGEVLKWFRVEIVPAVATHTVRVIPTERFLGLAMAVRTFGRDDVAVHGTPVAESAQDVSRVEAAAVEHAEKVLANAEARQS